MRRAVLGPSASVWVPASVVLVLAVSAMAVIGTSASSVRYVVLIAFIPIVGLALLRLPVHVLPAVALSFYSVGAVHFLPPGLAVGPSSVILLVWMLRRASGALSHAHAYRARASRSRDRRGARGNSLLVPALAIMLAVWLVLLTEVGELGSSSWGWLLSFVPVVIVPLLVPDLSAEARTLERTWVVLSAVLGAYALVEFVARANVVYWTLGAESSQHWSVYRAEGPFGHPLLFGTFLAVGALLAFGIWLEGHRGRSLVAALLALAGVLVTSSRGALVAVVVGVMLAVAIVALRPGQSRRGRAFGLLLLLTAGAVALIPSTPLVDRWVSDEAVGSSAARADGFDLALNLAESSGFLGTGAGTSSLAASLAGSTLPIEISPLQALVSLGVPGTILLLAIVIVGFSRALVAGRVAAVAGLAAFLVAISGYNYFDDRRSALILCGMIFVIAVGSRRVPASASAAQGIDERLMK